MKRYLLNSLLFLSALYSHAQCNDCLVASYPFSGSAMDISGNGNNGIVNGATLTKDRFGNENKAYAFDGRTSHINLGNAVGLKRYKSDYTVSFWVAPSSFTSNFQSFILSNRGNSGGSGIGLLGEERDGDVGKISNIVDGGLSASLVTGSQRLFLLRKVLPPFRPTCI